MLLQRGDLFDLPNGIFRLVDERPDNILVFTSEGRLAQDLRLTREELETMHGLGQAAKVDFFRTRNEHTGDEKPQLANDNAVFGPHEEHSPDAMRAKTLQFYVKAFDKDGRVSLGKKGLAAFIKRTRSEAEQRGLGFDVKPGTLWRVVRGCGEKGNRPLRVFRSRRGRTRRRRLNETVNDLLDLAVGYFWSARERNLSDAVTFFRAKMAEENARRRAEHLEPLPFPKRMETLRRRINAATNHANWARKYSKAEADQKFKGVREHLYADKPLELVIIDHTKVDTWTVLDSHINIPLGRATLTVAIDVATRMILGHLLSFEPPSLFSVAKTLQRVNRNKRYIRKVFADIPGTSDAWGHPETILVDNGLEFVGSSFQDALADIGTEVIWAPVRTPQYKAIGERFFQTLNTRLFHRLKGGVPYDPREMSKVGLDPRKDAVITLGDLDSLVHHAIIVYQNERHEGIQAIPARIWRDKIAKHGRRYIPDIKQLDSILGRVDTRTLTRAGIEFKNMMFHDQTATERLLEDMLPYEAKRAQSQKHRSSAKVQVKIKWDPADASCISVWNDSGKPKPHYVRLFNRDKKFSEGISFWHAERVHEYSKLEDLAFQTDEQKWEARNALQKHWEKVAGDLPLRTTSDARRGLSRTIGTYEQEHEEEPVEPLKDEEVSMPSVDSPPMVPTDIPAYERRDANEPPSGIPQSKAARKTAEETRRARKEESAKEKKHEARVKRRRDAKSSAQPSPQSAANGGASASPNEFINRIKGKWGIGK